ncbi:hypothetical protein V1264_019766 [Littorina saxatilis]|uniref:Hepatocyte growth factor receptor n=1 Tax=Littorina saxatilis TaxID=31220 RepID=A0AAN9B9J0_9CAEN
METSVYFSLCVLTTVLCTTRATLQYDFKHNVFHVAVDSQTGHVMVGGNNVVFMLDSNLTLLKNTTLKTCPSGTPRCDVIINVMEVDRTFRRLLVCGSDSKGQGHCWFLGLKDLKVKEIASFHSGQSGAGRERPVVHQTSTSSAPGPFFSRWIFASAIMYRKHGSAQKTNPVLSVVEIVSSGRQTEPHFAVNTSQQITKHSASFRMDLLDGFCHGSECFYLTLQQVNASSNEFISRIARVCAASLFPYVEIPFNLAAEDGGSEPTGTTYNRAVAFTLGGIGSENGTKPVVIAVFGKASPTSEAVDTQEGFAIAYIPLATLRKRIESTRMMCANSYDFAKIKTPDWDTGNFSDCVNETVREDRCPHAGEHNSVIQNQIGDPIKYSATVAGDDDMGHVTSVFTHTQPLQGQDKLDNHMTIYVTTSSGRVYMFHSRVLYPTDTLDVTQLPRHVAQREALTSGLRRDLRRDLALTARHFYLLSGSKVVARPVDYCTAIASCHECTQDIKGCNWCNTSHTCQLQAKCHNVQSCPPAISKFSPVSAPVSGGGQLIIEGTRLKVVEDPTVSLCGQDCPVVTFNKTSMICTVPPRPEAKAVTCDVTINMFQNSTRYFYNQSVTADNFIYTVPRVENYWPTRLLLSESADVMFEGEDLDTGSNVTVVFTSNNKGIVCRVEHRQWDALRCHITNMTSQDPSDNMTYPAHDVTRQDQCYDVSFTIDDFTLRSDHMTRFCHCSNPTVSSVDQDWIFAGGEVPVTVRGSNLDLTVVHLLLNINGTEFDGPTCDVCHGVTNGSCIVCCTPDVTNLTSSSYLGDVKADVTFSMTSKHSQEAVRYHSPLITVSVFRDPEFRFAKLNSTSSCVSVSPGSVIQIEGKYLPPSAAVTVKVGKQTCAETVFAQSSATIPCDLLPIWPSLNVSRPGNTRSGNTRPGNTGPGNTRPGNTRSGNTGHGNTTTCTQAGNEKQEGARRVDEHHVCCAGEGTAERDGESSDGGLSTRVVRVLVGGRVVRVGCVDLADGSTTTPDTNKLRALLPVIVGGGAGVVALFFVVCIVCSCVRHQKRKFEKRRKLHAQQSVFSETHLMQSLSSAGSAENSYVSVERLLNPTGEGKKQREIRDSGLLIPRSKLDLGNVIGQGNFGCVFEGHYQNSEVDSEDWTVVAVKTLLDPATHAIDIKGFIEEALLMKNFDHDHVLSLLGLSDGDRGPMVVLPYMERGDLLTYVKDEHTVRQIEPL